MIPLRDVIPTRTAPLVTVALIVANVIVFLYQLSLPERRLTGFVLSFGLIPAAWSWVAVFTSIFLHGNVLHIGTNMLCLWIFGDSVEDRLGHGRFLAFYLLVGVAAALAQAIAAPGSTIPMAGASGAIAGVMGAYFVLHPRSRVVTFVPMVFVPRIVEVPAILFPGVWLAVQIVGGAGSLATAAGSEPQAGIAFWALVAGFVAGASGVLVFRRPERQRVEWWNDLHSRP